MTSTSQQYARECGAKPARESSPPRRSPSGFRLEQLAAAYDRVMNSRDWQGPIRALIPVEDRAMVQEAVHWFTGAMPDVAPVPGVPDRSLVTTPGLRNLWGTSIPELPRMSFLGRVNSAALDEAGSPS